MAVTSTVFRINKLYDLEHLRLLVRIKIYFPSETYFPLGPVWKS